MSRSLLRGARTNSRFRSPSPGVVVVIAAFVAVRIAYWVTGGGFSTTALKDSWQLLDLHQLVAHPFQNVWLLHTQPPLFNLFVGTVLRWSPLSSALTFQIVYFLLALILVVALRALLVELGFAAFAATAGAVAVACDPGLLSYENAIIYELPVAALLVVSGLLCARYARTRRARTLTALVTVMTAIVMTRALLHPVWLGTMVALVVIAVRPRIGVRPDRRPLSDGLHRTGALRAAEAERSEQLRRRVLPTRLPGWSTQRVRCDPRAAGCLPLRASSVGDRSFLVRTRAWPRTLP